MKEELRSLRSFHDRDEDRRQLVTLLSQRCELFHADNAPFHEQFQPVGAFFNLAQRIAAFRDELSFAPRGKGFGFYVAYPFSLHSSFSIPPSYFTPTWCASWRLWAGSASTHANVPALTAII